MLKTDEEAIATVRRTAAAIAGVKAMGEVAAWAINEVRLSEKGVANHLNVPSRTSGFRPLSLEGLRRRTEMLIVAGPGRPKRVWVLDSLRQIDSQTQEALEYAPAGSGTLFLLALTSLYVECRAIPARAIARLRVRWYLSRRSHHRGEPGS